MIMREDISNDHIEATVGADQSGKGFEAISKTIGSPRQLLIFPGVGIPASSLPGQTVRCSEDLYHSTGTGDA